MYNYNIGLGFGSMYPVHMTRSDNNTCSKVDMCHHLNEYSAIGHWT